MTNYKYTLPERLVKKTAHFSEFRMGGMQVTIVTKDGEIYKKVLLSNCKHIIAIRGFRDLPFTINEIADIYQTEEDKSPKQCGDWYFWDY